MESCVGIILLSGYTTVCLKTYIFLRPDLACMLLCVKFSFVSFLTRFGRVHWKVGKLVVGKLACVGNFILRVRMFFLSALIVPGSGEIFLYVLRDTDTTCSWCYIIPRLQLIRFL